MSTLLEIKPSGEFADAPRIGSLTGSIDTSFTPLENLPEPTVGSGGSIRARGHILTVSSLTGFTKNLMRWYKENGRHHLPWRHTKDPYHILVSEIMLQQTQVDRVIPKYKAFLKQFSTLKKLANAPGSAVLHAWQGMGYNRRALFLKRLAQVCVEKHKGKIPQTYEALRELPGIGDYTARAVLSFAFKKPIALHDTNIRRIFSRMYFGKNPSAVAEKEIIKMIERQVAHTSLNPSSGRREAPLLPEERQGRGVELALYHGALMDFGSKICRAKPLCSICPMQKICKAAPKVLAEGFAGLEGRVVRNPQSKFEGSDRKIRGGIIEILRERKRITPPLLPLYKGRLGGVKTERLTKILQTLLRDGLIIKKGSAYALPE